MSYKTNPIGNRLGISSGWLTSIFPATLRQYPSEIQQNTKLYFFIKEYFIKRNIRLISFRMQKINSKTYLFLSIYHYKRIPKRIIRQRSKKPWIAKKNNKFYGFLPIRSRKFAKKVKTEEHTTKLYEYFRKKLPKRLNSLFQKAYYKSKYKLLEYRKRIKAAKPKKWYRPCRIWHLRHSIKSTGVPFKRKITSKRWKLKKYRANKIKTLKPATGWFSRWCFIKAARSTVVRYKITKKDSESAESDRQEIDNKKNKKKKKVIWWRGHVLRHYKRRLKYYNNYIRILVLRMKLRRMLNSYGFNIDQINITDPMKNVRITHVQHLENNPKYRHFRKERHFKNTIRLLHIFEKYPDATIIAQHFARELERLRKHSPFIYALGDLIRYWNFGSHRRILKKVNYKNKHSKGFLQSTPKMKRFNLSRFKKSNFLHLLKQWRKRTGNIIEVDPLPLTSLNMQRHFEIHNATDPKKKRDYKAVYKALKHDYRKIFTGIRIAIRGKINGASRTRLANLEWGMIPVQSFNEKVSFALAHARARTGVFSVRVWLYT